MNYIIDIIFIAILGIFIFKGYKDGFIKTVFGLLINLASVIIAFALAKPISMMFADKILTDAPKEISSSVAIAISFVIMYAVAHMAIAIIANILDIVSKLPVLNFTNKSLGIIMGAVLGILYACVFSVILGYGYPLLAEIYPEIFTDELLNNSMIYSFIHKLNLLDRLFDLIV